jgi:hypothetical protein
MLHAGATKEQHGASWPQPLNARPPSDHSSSRRLSLYAKFIACYLVADGTCVRAYPIARQAAASVRACARVPYRAPTGKDTLQGYVSQQ